MSEQSKNKPSAGRFPRLLVWGIRLGLPLLIVAGGLVGARKLIATGPKHERRPPGERTAVVETVRLQRTDRPITISTTGTVVPTLQLQLQPRVSGQIVQLNPKLVPGGRLQKGEMALALDPTDYQLALRNAQAQLAQAQFSLKTELGQQDIARHEWTLLDNKDKATALDEELALRKPHLEQAQANLDAAKAGVERAKLDLERCTVRAPFDAMVVERNVATGAMVSSQTTLATLVATSEYWVTATVPAARLPWIALPTAGQEGASATVYTTGANGGQGRWTGRIIQLLPGLETNGRLARVLVSVANPLARDTPLLLNSFVSVEIQGRTLEKVFVLPRSAVHEGNVVRLLGPDSRLVFQEVSPIWSEAESVVVAKGLEEGSELVLTDMASAVPGLKVVLAGDEPATGPETPAASLRGAAVVKTSDTKSEQ